MKDGSGTVLLLTTAEAVTGVGFGAALAATMAVARKAMKTVDRREGMPKECCRVEVGGGEVVARVRHRILYECNGASRMESAK